ncbi:secretory calcium-binding phosphoprotein 1 isoform X4 [Hippoglossus hippoglossus]|uniref:secretory calcium-binding phosphoprotein 1 isoform X4 n=1 Tax=Hippoglossus hippoglossus TaxID=8267 RepID=UPI00148DB81C|nr:secretory calcium-binding phosphoprotein 1 isoform X4 [Hippoglossus hippoglossus]
MKITIIMFCLIGAVFANPISFNALLDTSELDSNSTESSSVSQSSENNTSEQSSEESNSDQSSESESLESTSEDKTSEESDSQSDESDGSDSMTETRDNSMSSEENVRRSWVQVFHVVQDLSGEDNSSTEVKGQEEQLSTLEPTPTIDNQVDNPSSSSESSDTSEATAAPTTSESSSSESSETSETSESTEDSDSAEVQQMKTSDCVNGTQSCESDEYLFHDIGDDAHYGVDNLMAPDDDERELTLRR